ncbi:hypothetical protein G7Y89_g7256 [Cudoniella acicularis]|uniref:Ubiquitin-like protease family profile domain-containing protein n=1 Tax=Cudoniella acicularis TaxID=354080 RepID=A0A8H4RJP9_9HELO|nr:hypothetical protein G7Y89_g7256 [Cudoniella acicularis]
MATSNYHDKFSALENVGRNTRLLEEDLEQLRSKQFLDVDIVRFCIFLRKPAQICDGVVYIDPGFLNQLMITGHLGSFVQLSETAPVDGYNCGVHAIENVCGILRGNDPEEEKNERLPADELRVAYLSQIHGVLSLHTRFLNNVEETTQEVRYTLAITAPPTYTNPLDCVMMPFCIQFPHMRFSNLKGHWIVIFVSFRTSRWTILDSANVIRHNGRAMERRVIRLVQELLIGWPKPDRMSWRYERRDATRQDDSINCGVHVIANMLTRMNGFEPSVDRRRNAAELREEYTQVLVERWDQPASNARRKGGGTAWGGRLRRCCREGLVLTPKLDFVTLQRVEDFPQFYPSKNYQNQPRKSSPIKQIKADQNQPKNQTQPKLDRVTELNRELLIDRTHMSTQFCRSNLYSHALGTLLGLGKEFVRMNRNIGDIGVEQFQYSLISFHFAAFSAEVAKQGCEAEI